MANVTHHLKGIDLPANKDELIRYAKQQQAPKAVMDQLEKLDEGRFETMADVMQALGKEDESGSERLPIANYQYTAKPHCKAVSDQQAIARNVKTVAVY